MSLAMTVGNRSKILSSRKDGEVISFNKLINFIILINMHQFKIRTSDSVSITTLAPQEIKGFTSSPAPQ